VDNEDKESSPLEQADKARHEEPVPPADEYISLSVVTTGLVVELEHVSSAATVAEVVNRIRREAATDWSEAIILRRGSKALRALSPDESLRGAGVQSGDTLIFTPSATWGSGWQEVALFLGTSASAGVVGGAAYDLLKSTLRAMTARWQKQSQSHLNSVARPI
jgi:hypothetical protein